MAPFVMPASTMTTLTRKKVLFFLHWEHLTCLLLCLLCLDLQNLWQESFLYPGMLLVIMIEDYLYLFLVFSDLHYPYKHFYSSFPCMRLDLKWVFTILYPVHFLSELVSGVKASSILFSKISLDLTCLCPATSISARFRRVVRLPFLSHPNLCH